MRGPVLVLGGRSDIGLAAAHAFAALGHPVQLAARHVESLAPEQSDLSLRHGIDVSVFEFDVLDLAAHEAFLDQLPVLPEIVVCAIGLLGNQEKDARDIEAAHVVMRSNFEGPASILAALANRFEARGSGVIVGISSVAGDRGRASNYIYGSAKAGFTAFLSGLRNRLAKRGVHVVTVLPGFVATRMTQDLNLPKALTAAPAEVGRAIEKAVRLRQNIVYTRPVWQLIMLIIKLIPERIFKQLKI
jgi:short-subunit dehydrogenase